MIVTMNSELKHLLSQLPKVEQLVDRSDDFEGFLAYS